MNYLVILGLHLCTSSPSTCKEHRVFDSIPKTHDIYAALFKTDKLNHRHLNGSDLFILDHVDPTADRQVTKTRPYLTLASCMNLDPLNGMQRPVDTRIPYSKLTTESFNQSNRPIYWYVRAI